MTGQLKLTNCAFHKFNHVVQSRDDGSVNFAGTKLEIDSGTSIHFHNISFTPTTFDKGSFIRIARNPRHYVFPYIVIGLLIGFFLGRLF